MNIADMQALVAVVETGSLAHAAVKLHLTQPAVTRRIQRLEETIGLRLLDRDSKPARPTPDGRAAYTECVRVLAAADGLKAVAGRRPDGDAMLRLGVSHGAGDLVLPALAEAFREAGRISVEAGLAAAHERALAEGRLDAAILFRDVDQEFRQGSGAERLARIPISVVAPRALGLPARTELRALRGHRWVLCPDGCFCRRALAHGLYGAGQPLDVAAAVWGYSHQARLVAAGFGLGLLPPHVLDDARLREAVMPIEVADFSAALDLCLVSGTDAARLAPRLDRIAAGLAAVFGDDSTTTRPAGAEA